MESLESHSCPISSDFVAWISVDRSRSLHVMVDRVTVAATQAGP